MEQTARDLLIAYGPALLGFAATILSGVIGAVGYMLKKFFEIQAAKIDGLSADIKYYEAANQREHAEVREALGELENTMHDVKNENSRELARIDSKMEVVMRFMEPAIHIKDML